MSVIERCPYYRGVRKERLDCTEEPRYNETLYNEVFGKTNDFLYPRSSTT